MSFIHHTAHIISCLWGTFLKYGGVITSEVDNRWADLDYPSIGGNFFPVNSAIAIRSFSNETCEYGCELFKNMRAHEQSYPHALNQRQFLVMNDRSQAGSVLKPGQIQLMQQRRLSSIDGGGVHALMRDVDPRTCTDLQDFIEFENLSDYKKDGKCMGVRTAVTYYVEFMNKVDAGTVSKQRHMQHKIDGPLQYFTNTGTFEKSRY